MLNELFEHKLALKKYMAMATIVKPCCLHDEAFIFKGDMPTRS